jgi:hypothetical protein
VHHSKNWQPMSAWVTRDITPSTGYVALPPKADIERDHRVSLLYANRVLKASQQIAAPFDHLAGEDCCSLLPASECATDSLLKVNLIGQVVAPPNWRHVG